MGSILDKTLCGTRTRTGKAMAVLLTVALSFMAWNTTPNMAFADDTGTPAKTADNMTTLTEKSTPADPQANANENTANSERQTSQTNLSTTPSEGTQENSGNNAADELAQPQQPDVEGMEISEANAAITDYNAKVDNYNAAAEQENTARQKQYNQDVAAVEEHNAAEDAKVTQNQADLAAQDKREALAAKHESNTSVMAENRTTNPDELPTDWSGELSSNPQTISVEKSTDTVEELIDEITYRILNIHIYLDEENDGTYWGTDIKDEIVPDDEYWSSYTVNQSFDISQHFKDHLVLAEWELAEASGSDVVSLQSEHKVVGYKSEAFYRYLPGYYNGFWLPTHELASIDHATDYEWDEYGAQTVKAQYDHSTYLDNVINLYSLWIYTFFRTGEEPTTVEEYTPQYMDAPKPPVFLEMLEHMALLDEPTEPVVPVTPTPDPQDPVTPTPDPQDPETPVTPTTDEPTPQIPDNPVTPKPNEPAVPVVPTPVVPNITPAPAPVQIPVSVPAASTTPVTTSVSMPSATTRPATPSVTSTPTSANKTEIIEDDDNALVSGSLGSWSLFDLICTVIAVLLSAVMLIRMIGRNRKENDDDETCYAEEENNEIEIKRRRALRLTSLVPAIGSTVLLLLTQDFTQPMAIFDAWSLVFAIIALINIVLIIVSCKREEDDNSDDRQKTYAGAAA